MSDIISCRPDLRPKKNPNNGDVLEQLEDIVRLALRDYPYDESSRLDDELAFTLGIIAGTARKAIADYQETTMKLSCRPTVGG